MKHDLFYSISFTVLTFYVIYYILPIFIILFYTISFFFPFFYIPYNFNKKLSNQVRKFVMDKNASHDQKFCLRNKKKKYLEKFRALVRWIALHLQNYFKTSDKQTFDHIGRYFYSPICLWLLMPFFIFLLL